MKFIISGKNIDITDGLRSAVQDKIGKLEKYFTPETEVHVTLSVEKDRQKIEVTIPVKGSVIRSEQVSNDMYVSIDLVEEIIERQLKKYKNKIIDSFPLEGFEMPSEHYGSPVYLTLDDVDVIAKADFSDDKELGIQRDIFVFQCNVGCRIGNLLRLKKRDIINGAVEYIPTKTIKERAKTVVVPLNAIAMSIVEKYKDVPGDQLLPFISSQNYNKNIKTILEKAGITYLVTKLDSVTRTESKVPINEMANSHMARRTFIGNIYKLVKAPNLISALTGHAEGSRAFNRYRDIDIDMKRDLVKILEGKR